MTATAVRRCRTSQPMTSGWVDKHGSIYLPSYRWGERRSRPMVPREPVAPAAVRLVVDGDATKSDKIREFAPARHADGGHRAITRYPLSVCAQRIAARRATRCASVSAHGGRAQSGDGAHPRASHQGGPHPSSCGCRLRPLADRERAWPGLSACLQRAVGRCQANRPPSGRRPRDGPRACGRVPRIRLPREAGRTMTRRGPDPVRSIVEAGGACQCAGGLSRSALRLGGAIRSC